MTPEEKQALMTQMSALGPPALDDTPVYPKVDPSTYEALSNSDYEYRPEVAKTPGAGTGDFNGPMAHELKAIPGVVRRDPKTGLDQVDTGRLALSTASDHGALRREVTALRDQVQALGGDPEAVLARVNRRGPTRPAATGDVELGLIEEKPVEPTLRDVNSYGDWSTLEGAGDAENAYFNDLIATRNIVADAEDKNYEAEGKNMERYKRMLQLRKELADKYGVDVEPPEPYRPLRDPLKFNKEQSPYDTEFNRTPQFAAPLSDEEQARLRRQQYDALQGGPALDHDEEMARRLRSDAWSAGPRQPEAERQQQILDALRAKEDADQFGKPYEMRDAPQIARELNFNSSTGRVTDNLRPEDVVKAMQKRREISL